MVWKLGKKADGTWHLSLVREITYRFTTSENIRAHYADCRSADIEFKFPFGFRSWRIIPTDFDS